MSDLARPTCEVRRPGRVAYADALRLQEDLVAQRQRGEGSDTLILLEHPRVLTLGRNSREENILLDAAALSERGFETFEVGRGGDVTYHGPGQLVGYPIVDLSRRGAVVHAYVHRLEGALIRTVGRFGIGAECVGGQPGIWVAGRKLASIGIGGAHSPRDEMAVSISEVVVAPQWLSEASIVVDESL